MPYAGGQRETHRQGRTFFLNISSSSAGVRRDVSGMRKKEATTRGAEIPLKKKAVLRPQLLARQLRFLTEL